MVRLSFSRCQLQVSHAVFSCRYGISGQHIPLFETALRNAAPELFEEQPDLLFQLVTLMTPARLVRAGVPVTRVKQVKPKNYKRFF